MGTIYTQDSGYHKAKLADSIQEVRVESQIVRGEFETFSDVFEQFKNSEFMKELKSYTEIKKGIL